MKITFLGTAAAEGFPALYCSCDNCKKARKLGGKNLRTRSQAILDGVLLIDYPADTYAHVLANNIDLSDVKSCLITHIHGDHFYPKDFSYLRAGFSVPKPDYKLTVYGSEDAKESVEEIAQRSPDHLAFSLLTPFEPVMTDGYKVTPLKAYHGTAHPYFYAVQKDGKSLLYAHDTDYFCEETWEYLEHSGIRFDLVSLDCTEGNREDLDYHGHMCLGRNIKCKNRMLESGLADEKSIFVLNHFSHNGTDSVYEDFKDIAKPYGFLVSYDGMTVDF